jgi:hypothetical protein
VTRAGRARRVNARDNFYDSFVKAIQGFIHRSFKPLPPLKGQNVKLFGPELTAKAKILICLHCNLQPIEEGL